MDNIFSDALYRPFMCANLDIDHLLEPERFNILRMQDLDVDSFNSKWSQIPFILTSPVKKWKAYNTWTFDSLRTRYHDVVFATDVVDWPLKTYLEYMHHNEDESPLYLFDSKFMNKTELMGEYDTPCPFKEDLFSVFGRLRPEYAWLVIGPRRSGSTFHKDPNGTSAWNAVIKGTKYWLLVPPHLKPPGTHVSADHSEITTPLSLGEWMYGFFAERKLLQACYEGICNPGEVLYVPTGWYHLVINLENTIAITQNFVPRASLTNAANFLRDQKDQVSGFAECVKDPYELFRKRMRELRPELLLHEGPSLLNSSLDSGLSVRRKKRHRTVDNESTGRPPQFAFQF